MGGWCGLAAAAAIFVSEEAAEEAGVLLRLSLLLAKLVELLAGFRELALGLGELGLGLLQGVILDDDGLGEDVDGVGVAAEALPEQMLGVVVLLGDLGLVDAIDQALDHLLFLGGHGRSLSCMAVSVWKQLALEGYADGRKRLHVAACGFDVGPLMRSKGANRFQRFGLCLRGEAAIDARPSVLGRPPRGRSSSSPPSPLLLVSKS